MRVSAFALVFLSYLLLASCSRNALPSIKDAQALQKDCVDLYQQFPLEATKTNQIAFGNLQKRMIPPANWPASVQALHPFKVTRDKYAIAIWILQGYKTSSKDGFERGYYVHTNLNLSPPRIAHGGGGSYNLHDTNYNGIDVFYEPGAVL